MRANLLLIVLALLLLAGSLAGLMVMQRTAADLAQEARAVAEALPDRAAAGAQLEGFAAHWEGVQRRWQAVAIHEDLDHIAQALWEAREALDEGSDRAVHAALEQLARAVEDVAAKEVPSLGNIL